MPPAHHEPPITAQDCSSKRPFIITVSYNQLQLASQTSSVRVSGCAVAVAGGVLPSVLVGGWWVYSMPLCGLNRWGWRLKSSALSGAGRGTGWGGRGGAIKKKCSEDRGEGRGRGWSSFLSRRPPISFRLFCLTALWPPSWFPAGPGVTWSPWGPERGPLRDVAGSALPPQQEKRLQTPGCRAWLVRLHLRESAVRLAE